MSVLLIGASFREISLEELELLDEKSQEIRDVLFSDSANKYGITGCVVVSTCSRFEVYVETDSSELTVEFIAREIARITGLKADRLKIRSESAAISHLFRVTAGLESMVVGEVEVAGQVKRALIHSQKLKRTSSSIEAIFQRSAKIAKKVVNETELGKAGRSFITGGLDILKNRNFAIKDKRVLVVGTGAYARVVISALRREGIGNIFVYSHSDRAETFSQTHSTTPVPQDELSIALGKVDFVVSCSGTQRNTITPNELQDLDGEIFPIIDLSLTRDIERSVEDLSHVMMIDLKEIHRNASNEHFDTLNLAESIIERAAVTFIEELNARRNNALIREMRASISSNVEFEKAVETLIGLNSEV